MATPKTTHTVMLILTARALVARVVAQGLFLLAIRREDARFVVPLFYATLVCSALYGFVIFEVIPSALSGLGAGVILLGALLMAWSERRRGQ